MSECTSPPVSPSLLAVEYLHQLHHAYGVELPRLEAERDRWYAEAVNLRGAIQRAGFAVMQTSGAWSIHDVGEKAKADEDRTTDVIARNIELEMLVVAMGDRICGLVELLSRRAERPANPPPAPGV